MNKESKNILLISPFFYPEPISTGKFNTDIVMALKDAGHNVTVLCSHPIYPKWIPEESHATLDGVLILRGGKNIKYSKNSFLRRIILEIWFASYILRNIFKRQKDIHILIPVFPPSLGFYLIIPFIKKGIEKIGMVHDLQEVYSKSKKGFINKVASLLINKVEGNTFRKCDKLIFLSEEMKDTAKEFYKLNEEKLFVQYPFATVNKNNITSDLESILPSNITNIVYSGALGEKQNPTGLYNFYNYASQKLKNTRFHIFSQGQAFEELRGINENTNIYFHDLVPRENIEELYLRSTVQIVPQLQGTSKGSLPSKLPNLLASGCKILFITDKDSEIDFLFKKYGLDKIVTSWENECLFDALKCLLDKGDETLNKQKKVAEDLFSIQSMTDKIIK